jgi:hypothetical protein
MQPDGENRREGSTLTPLTYLTYGAITSLHEGIESNLARYRRGDFKEFASSGEWTCVTKVSVDDAKLAQLSSLADSSQDAEAAIAVWHALPGMTPSLAREGRVWTRLCHVECLEYSRARWIKPDSGAKKIAAHLFSRTWTTIRDDNAIGRLWWGAHLAREALPEQFDNAVKAMFQTQDIRLNLMERSWMSSQRVLRRAVLKAIIDEPMATATETNFRQFMRSLNVRGGGILFDLLDDGEADAIVKECIPTNALKRPNKKKKSKAQKKKKRRK